MFVRGARSSCMDMVYLQHGGGNYRRRAPRSAPRTESVKLPAKCTDGIFASTCSQSVPCKFRRTCLPARAAYHRHSLVQSRVRSSSSFPVFSGVALSSRPPPLSLCGNHSNGLLGWCGGGANSGTCKSPYTAAVQQRQ